MRKIMVMGGSFNPPTAAHLARMCAALEQTGAERGVFVPSSEADVTRKLRDLPEGADRLVLPERLRLSMLNALCAGDERLSVDSRELGTADADGHAVATLEALRREHPDAQVCFLPDGDDLSGAPRGRLFEALAGRFPMVLFVRDDASAWEAIDGDPALAAHRDAFMPLRAPEGLDGVSSAEARRRVLRGEPADDLLPCDVYTLLLAYLQRQDNTILCFKSEHAFLSNFYPLERLVWQGLTYGSSEAAFQAAKCLTPDDRRQFCELSASASKHRGHEIAVRPDWDQVKDGVMEDIVRAKFAQHPALAEKLVATGNQRLVEGNTWHDDYWGVDLCTLRGQNRLGEILMRVRAGLTAPR